MTAEPNQLGDYLRARRELVTPEQAGIPVLGVRRVPGLRREEVAMLAGISADVLAANALATALSPRLAAGANRLRDVFLDPAERALFPEWDKATEALVAGFRQSVGTDTDNPRFIELVGELSLASPRFRRLWARHDVAGRRGAPVHFDHPQVGELHLNREKLLVSGTEGIMLAVYHPDPGTDDADKLALLASAMLAPATPHAATTGEQERHA